jgi:hypothetical protein
MLSDATVERLKQWEEKLIEFMSFYGCDRQEAIQRVYANNSYKVFEMASRIDKRTKANALAELHAQAAANATRKAQLDIED